MDEMLTVCHQIQFTVHSHSAYPAELFSEAATSEIYRQSHISATSDSSSYVRRDLSCATCRVTIGKAMVTTKRRCVRPATPMMKRVAGEADNTILFENPQVPVSGKEKRKEVTAEDGLPDLSKLEIVRIALHTRTGSLWGLHSDTLFQQGSLWPFPPKSLGSSPKT